MKDIVAERRNKWITTIKKKKKRSGKSSGNRKGEGRPFEAVTSGTNHVGYCRKGILGANNGSRYTDREEWRKRKNYTPFDQSTGKKIRYC